MPERPTPTELTALLEATLEASPDGIVVFDATRRVIRWNNQFLKFFGLAAEMLPASAEGILHAILPLLENAAEIEATAESVWRQLDLELMDLFRFKDGRVFERFCAPLRIGGEIAGRVTTFRDVTQTARTEQALARHRALLERAQEVAHIGSWVAALDNSDRLEWSSESHRIFGISPGEFLGTASFFYARVHASDRESVRAAGVAAVAGQRPFDIEHRIVRSDGSIRWVHERADIEYDAKGRAVRMIGTVQDITERRMLEDQLRQSQKMEAIGRLAGGIAHDLNNALTAIAGYAELAIGQLPATSPARADVEEIRRGAERAGSVTRQLLAFSRKDILEPRLFDLNVTIMALGRLLDRLLGANIEVRTHLTPGIPAILGDPGQFEQAVINLAVNARDAMPEGGHLELSTSFEALDEKSVRANAPMSPGSYVVLRVSDSGHGMSRETQARIFEPFFTTKETGKGTGLGLSMVYGTLKQIGGFIFVDSEPNRGTTFRLYFRPAAPPLTAPQPTPAAQRARVEETILVAEDEPAVRNLVASALRADHYSLLLAGSAEEALSIADSHAGTIHLLLTDAIMPGKSGIELANILVARRPGLRVIVMSGYTEETLSGFDDRVELLQKPFAPRELRRRIREALDQVRENSR